MARHERIYTRLDSLEGSFAEELRKHLIACVQGQNGLLFCSSEFFPDNYPKYLSTQHADDLLVIGEEIRGLRVKAGEPFKGSLAWRFRECCRLWSDDSDPHRGSAQTIARQLLTEIESQQTEARD